MLDALDGAQAGINIAGRNINNLKHADDTILMAEIKEELKSLLMKVKKTLCKTMRFSKEDRLGGSDPGNDGSSRLWQRLVNICKEM